MHNLPLKPKIMSTLVTSRERDRYVEQIMQIITKETINDERWIPVTNGQ